jgi:hypothetical protein
MPSRTLKRPLSGLFGAAPAPPASLAERIAALDSAATEQIIAIASGEGEQALRAAAVERLHDGETLRTLAGLSEGTAPASSIGRLARQRVATLIDAGTMELASLGTSPQTICAVLAIADLCADPTHLARALASIRDHGQLVKLVVEGSSSRVRQLAAQRIEDPEELRQLLKQLGGRDKNVYRILRQKSDALRAEEQRVAQLESDIEALCASLESLSLRLYDPLYAPAFEHYEARWRALEAQAAPPVLERARRAIDRCRTVIAGHVAAAAQQAAAVAQQAAAQAAREAAIVQAAEEARRRDEAAAVTAAEAARLHEADEQARRERRAAEALAVRQIGALIARTHRALRDGHTGPAAGLRRAIEEKLTAVPAVPAFLARQVQALDAKLGELKAWKDYAVAPKRTELIMEIEALVGSSEPPQALADRIKDLREQWKTISKGIAGESAADWQRFNQAAETAYRPCREYFETQARQRAENVERRKSVLQRLLAFETAQSGEHTDWRAVAIVLREARQEWRQIYPVDRVACKAVEQDFDASLGRLRARLENWQAQNVADKRALIQRAQALLAKEDRREAVELVKALQRQWQDVGPGLRDQEEALWNEFRAHCDAVYQQRQLAHAEYAAGLEANKAQALALCVEAEQVAAQSGPALLEGAAKIPQWRAGFEALGELPRADARAVQDRFERAVRQCQARVSQQRAADTARSFDDLLEAARRIQAYGWAVARGTASSEREALKSAAEAFIAGVAQWPKGSAPALTQAWSKADAAVDRELPANETALRRLCIRSEIAAELPTPPEDQMLRREYQLQRLVQGMGQGLEPTGNNWQALALEWVSVGPVAITLYESLLARFLRRR